jgi:nucleotide-binding universal stress UspA family protein
MAWWPSIDAGEGHDLLTPDGHGHPRRIRSVLCALDRRAWAGDVLDVAIDAAVHHGARLTLMAVVQRPHPLVALAGQTAAQVLDGVERDTLSWLACALDDVPSDLRAGVVLRVGRPAPTILAEAIAGDHDLLVLGRRPRLRAWLPRWTSVSGRVAGRTDRMVVTVPLG